MKHTRTTLTTLSSVAMRSRLTASSPPRALEYRMFSVMKAPGFSYS
ncbi:hypothetical protein [uncultured Dubosiella sp.]|nr:hypothetical protein [uncultured Dubosiella sp.]